MDARVLLILSSILLAGFELFRSVKAERIINIPHHPGLNGSESFPLSPLTDGRRRHLSWRWLAPL